MQPVLMPISSSPTVSPSISLHHRYNPMLNNEFLWIHKQAEHSSTRFHPLKNTIRVTSAGYRLKFDGKQWRPLCQSAEGFECRNLAFRSSLCQKHFYKLHLAKRSYKKAIDRPFPIDEYAEKTAYRIEEINEDSIQFLDQQTSNVSNESESSRKEEFHCSSQYFSIDRRDSNSSKVESSKRIKRIESTCDEGEKSIDLDGFSSFSKVIESIRLGLPPLTRTEEKALAHELISQLANDVSFLAAEQIARRRASEIVLVNYSQHLSPMNISNEWFYDFLLRNPRLPIHFQSWFRAVQSTMPSSDHLLDIKMWELRLITRAVLPSSSASTGSASP